MFNQRCSPCDNDQTPEPDANYDSLPLLSECKFPTIGRGGGGVAASKKVPPPGSEVFVIQKEISSGGRGSAEDFPLPRMNKKIQSAEGRGLAAVGRTSQFGLSVYDFIRVALL